LFKSRWCVCLLSSIQWGDGDLEIVGWGNCGVAGTCVHVRCALYCTPFLLVQFRVLSMQTRRKEEKRRREDGSLHHDIPPVNLQQLCPAKLPWPSGSSRGTCSSYVESREQLQFSHLSGGELQFSNKKFT